MDEVNKLRNDEGVVVTLSGEEFTIEPGMVDIRVESKEGIDATYKDNNFIVLNTTLTTELVNEGIARETISKIQQIRQNNGFEITDRVKVFYEGSKEYTNAISEFITNIMDETLAVEFNEASDLTDSYDINEYKVKIRVDKI